MIYSKGQVPNCPHCEKPLEDPIEDFVVAGRIGPNHRTKDRCGHCSGCFSVEAQNASTFLLEEEPDEEEEEEWGGGYGGWGPPW
jgi:hypothetical protein